MIFSELYSAYYNTVAKILSLAIEGELTEKTLADAVREAAFAESAITIAPALKKQKWQLLNPDLSTPILHSPTMPLTLLQKRFIKAVLCDKRIALFDIDQSGFEDVTPLFTDEDYIIYDKYSDGDNYSDPGYISRFRTVLSALRGQNRISLTMINRRGVKMHLSLMPKKLEFSEKDDKFRLIGETARDIVTVNLGRLTSCELCENGAQGVARPRLRDTAREVVLDVFDERNALERVMLHFAHFEKQAVRISENVYRLTVKYDADDESELIIRILSFGPMVKVVAPARFVGLIKNRLMLQRRFTL
ncbi:MAG: WYL domain-containing protein [Clostridia bacterium]|nr:WYL domain-containing protein [Clostridia bacterium]